MAKSSMKILCFFLFFLLLSANAEEKILQTQVLKNITFQTPVPFSAPAVFGMEAFTLSYPANSPQGKETFEIRLVFISTQMLENINMDEVELLKYVKTTFLGTAKKAEKNNKRFFMNRSIEGELLSKKIPRPLLLEVYLLSLQDGSKLAISFIYEKDMDIKIAQEIMTTISNTLKYKE